MPNVVGEALGKEVGSHFSGGVYEADIVEGGLVLAKEPRLASVLFTSDHDDKVKRTGLLCSYCECGKST